MIIEDNGEFMDAATEYCAEARGALRPIILEMMNKNVPYSEMESVLYRAVDLELFDLHYGLAELEARAYRGKLI